jgi:8-oxo-dGTP diphosphatase
MGVRSTLKAIVLHDGKVLLNRCYDNNNGTYYSLPGGGQQQGEAMVDALKRECLEETGYSVEPVRFAALMEEICLDSFILEHYAEYAHKMLHIFVCKLASETVAVPTETDESQVAIEWVDLSSIPAINLLPKQVKAYFTAITDGVCPQYLGTSYLEHNHG